MNPTDKTVERHYGRPGIYQTIVNALKLHGVDTDRLQPEDLSPIDEIHIRGREGTVELADRISWPPGSRVLDVGCGIGGSSRYLARRFNCNVIGVDLTQEYITAAQELSTLAGFNGELRFHQASALELPFPSGSFDIVWTQHVQMNIEEKQQFYSEMARVLRPGGHLLFHDIFRVSDVEPYYPLPWASNPSYSFLATPATARTIVERLGLKIIQWEDTTERSVQWLDRMEIRMRESNGKTLSPLVIIGDDARPAFVNIKRSLIDNRLRILQAVAVK